MDSVDDRMLVVFNCVIATSIRGAGIDVQEHPVVLFEAVFDHRKAKLATGCGDKVVDEFDVQFDLPSYVAIPSVTSQALNVPSFKRVDAEASALTKVNYFTRAPREKIRWDILTTFVLKKGQVVMVQNPPALFTPLVTAALSSSTEEQYRKEAAVVKATVSNAHQSSGKTEDTIRHLRKCVVTLFVVRFTYLLD
ncbi:hypothetical protein Moror_12807 [Moniliophthora roreri MCA 2997]|uniref:Uncharacterized protein n=1 Tax=Moniliophthora roreri (strain MCA 2997) TaxID=1381753 RepID=V2XK05_MONRO|nr:hypothetical protein Moror_12807 [Moniliophthora roreri MCA 2997]